MTFLHYWFGGFENWLSEQEYKRWLEQGVNSASGFLDYGARTVKAAWSTVVPEDAGDWSMANDEIL
jgi:hypothetical protein